MRTIKNILSIVVFAFLVLVAAMHAGAQSAPPAWSSATTYHAGDQAQVYGNVMRAVTNPTAGKFLYSQWELWELRGSATYTVGVGQTFSTLAAAWTFIQNARIASGAYLHLFVSYQNGIFLENFSTPFSLDHTYGSQISIIGEGSSNATLGFTGPASDGLLIDSNHKFGSISGLTLTSTNGGLAAIHSLQNSSIASISNIAVGTFQAFLFAETGSRLFCDSSILLNNVNTGIAQANDRSSIIFGDGLTITADQTLQALFAARNSFIQAHNAFIELGANAGAEAIYGSYIDVSGSTLKNNTRGIWADTNSRIKAENCTISGSNFSDIECDNGSVVDAIGSTFTTSNGTVYTS